MSLEERKALVEEMLRWSTVTMHFRRTVTRDTELRGRQLTRRRQGRHVVRLGELRRGALRRPLRLPTRAHPERPRGLRSPEPPPVPRRPPGAPGDARPVRGDRRALVAASSSAARPSACARTSSAASSTCRSRSPGASHAPARGNYRNGRYSLISQSVVAAAKRVPLRALDRDVLGDQVGPDGFDQRPRRPRARRARRRATAGTPTVASIVSRPLPPSAGPGSRLADESEA